MGYCIDRLDDTVGIESRDVGGAKQVLKNDKDYRYAILKSNIQVEYLSNQSTSSQFDLFLLNIYTFLTSKYGDQQSK